jgi:hypothetical protein
MQLLEELEVFNVKLSSCCIVYCRTAGREPPIEIILWVGGLDDTACSRHAQLYTINKKIEWANSHTHVVTLQVFQPLFVFKKNS